MELAAPQRGWIYGRRNDIMLFFGTILIGFIYATLNPVYIPTLFIFIVFNIGHSWTTNFFVFTSKRIMKEHTWFYAIPFLVLLFWYFAYKTIPQPYFWQMFVMYSLYHFMKQQQAWFHISSAKCGISGRFQKTVTTMTAWSAVFVPQIISMSNGSSVGWFIRNDVPKLPAICGKLAIAFAVVSFSLYFYMEIKRYIATKEIHWPKHFHLAVGAFVWYSARLELFWNYSETFGPMLVMAGHSFPYFYLGFRYIKQRTAKHEAFIPNLNNAYLFFAFVIAVSFSFTYYQKITWTEQASDLVWMLFMTNATTHYVLDTFLWKKKTHPEGAEIFTLCDQENIKIDNKIAA